jgi:hypothetical protein
MLARGTACCRIDGMGDRAVCQRRAIVDAAFQSIEITEDHLQQVIKISSSETRKKELSLAGRRGQASKPTPHYSHSPKRC